MQAQRELSNRDRRLAAAFDAAPIGMAVVAADGRWLQVNPALGQLTGRTTTDLTGSRVHDLTHPDDRAAGVALLAEILAGRRDGYQRRSRLRHHNGDYLPVDITVTAVRDDDEPPYLVVQIQASTATPNPLG